MVQKASIVMSNRGGYGFVLNGQEKIIYIGKGSDFESLGDTVLGWLRKVKSHPADEQRIIMEQIQNLQKVEGIGVVPDLLLDDILKIDSSIRPVSITREYDWHSVMRHIAYDPQDVLNIGHYIDGAWILSGLDCEYLYMIDFDKGMFEVYYDSHMARNIPASGRFNTQADGYEATTREEATYVNMIASYAFKSLPESIANLQEDIYEPEFWQLFG
jgi:hypothetical protein